MRTITIWVVMIGLGIGIAPVAGWAETAKARIQGTTEGSTMSGTATLADSPSGLSVSIQVSNVPPGKHGLHIHQYGECTGEGKAAGGHYNPNNVSHGFLPSDGLTKAHPGDMGNIEVGPDGHGTLNVTLPDVSLTSGKYTVAGRAIILHDKVDDFSQPTGNAGGRIGCGPILITKE